MNEPIFFTPVFKYRVWGGNNLQSFGYTLPYERTGECWGISAHRNGESIVKGGRYDNVTLRDLYRDEPALFGESLTSEEFPLLVKLLDATDDLSVQVHPNDDEAKQLENDEAYGKTECWYVVDARPGSELILGHHAETTEEFQKKVAEEDWHGLLKKVPVQKGDFVYVPSGTIHAIGKGIIILETQQSSDTTYRVYDFDRVESDGKKRELHLDKAIQVTNTPDKQAIGRDNTTISASAGGIINRLVQAPSFSVYELSVRGEFQFERPGSYLLATVVQGEGTCHTNQQAFSLAAGDHFLLPNDLRNIVMDGDMTIICSHPN
ncbi:mannose-6-phosphate isomerase, class I [Geomicrobium sp. JCM 19039]|uniref:mannose-6-phosphate isomerase, class I n=1 Tax=Geomicrobium sp. JCM 19039 TaxID=1460636 RepID=UPI00045F19C5|nr:mannose-6-phosphate isomerase, class I [Geomicrobium sp. JCM 19039]GAK14166.1 mannose-6-phosphate isomerase [Geomicrobium sp. JCM 19039]